VAPCVRLKMPTEGETVIQDEVQGEVRVPNNELDDMILLRADGSPTYMLAVVVDDHDMGVTHVIRGDDHLTNCFRQAQLFEALGWAPPAYGHIPLIHGPDGAKLSKRHGAQSVTDFAEMGYLPEAVNCYLLRLGWSHGDQEIFTWEEAVTLFDTDGINKAPSRLDFEKLGHVNQHFMKQRPTAEMVELAAPFVEAKCGIELDEPKRRLLETAMPELASRAKTLVELADQGAFLFQPRPLAPSDKAQKLLDKADAQIIADIRDTLSELTDFSAGSIETALRGLSESKGIGMKKIAQPTRAALTGSHASPGIGEVAAWLGQAEAVARLDDAHQNRLKADQNQIAATAATGGGKPDEFKAAAPGM